MYVLFSNCTNNASPGGGHPSLALKFPIEKELLPSLSTKPYTLTVVKDNPKEVVNHINTVKRNPSI